jgi:hypothetical protein
MSTGAVAIHTCVTNALSNADRARASKARITSAIQVADVDSENHNTPPMARSCGKSVGTGSVSRRILTGTNAGAGNARFDVARGLARNLRLSSASLRLQK